VERKENKNNNNNNKIIIRNGAKIISLQTLFGRLNYHEQYIQLMYRNLSKLGISQANSLLAW
jgi:hypothetical protein